MYKTLDETINIWSNFNLNIELKLEYIKQIFLPVLLVKSWNKYQWESLVNFYRKAFLKSKHKKNRIVIIKELIEESIRRKCLPFHYFRYWLYDISTKKEHFLPDTVFYHRILPKINKYTFLLDDKIIFDSIARSHNIPLPVLIFTYKKWYIYSSRGLISNKEEFASLLETLSYEKVILKHSNYAHWGEWIHIFSKDTKTWKYYNDDLGYLDLNLLKQSKNDWILQEFCENQDDIKQIYDNALNTFRILTYFNDKEVLILWTILKFWVWSNKTDNAWSWWIYCSVDDAWKLWKVAFNQNLELFDKHPDSWISFEKIKINNFKQVISTAKKASYVFPDTKIIWWDIALTTNGPIVIEGNSSPWLAIIQRPLRWILKNPNFLLSKLFK